MRWSRTHKVPIHVLLLASVAFVLPKEGLAQAKAGCQSETISVLMSPDDAWVALVQESTCSDGYFVTTIADTVRLARRDTTDAVELSSRELQITIPNKSLIGLRKSGYQEVHVTVKYEPDDPVERQHWRKSLGLTSK
jgi:hypothetical protein